FHSFTTSSLGNHRLIFFHPEGVLKNPSRRPCVLFFHRSSLLQLILHLGDTRLSAGFLLGLAARRPAQAHGSDRLITDHDRNPAAERNDIRKTALTGDVAFGGPFRPFGRRPPERQGCIGLPAGELKIVGRRSIALKKYAQPA